MGTYTLTYAIFTGSRQLFRRSARVPDCRSCGLNRYEYSYLLVFVYFVVFPLVIWRLCNPRGIWTVFTNFLDPKVSAAKEKYKSVFTRIAFSSPGLKRSLVLRAACIHHIVA